MKFLVEVGRFILTAVAVGIAIPTGFTFLSLFNEPNFSFEWFLGIAAISFVMAMIGGLLFGFPALWVANRLGWSRPLGKLAAYSCVVGAVGGILLSALFWQGNIGIIVAGASIWAAMGAAAGVVASCVWFWLHENEEHMSHNA